MSHEMIAAVVGGSFGYVVCSLLWNWYKKGK